MAPDDRWDKAVLPYHAPAGQGLPRAIWWLAVLGIAVGVERILLSTANLWWSHVEFGGLDHYTVLAGAEILLGVGLMAGAVMLLRGWQDAPWLIMLTEKLYLLTLAAWLIVTVGGNIRVGLPPLPYANHQDFFSTIDMLSKLLLSAIYPAFALLLLPTFTSEQSPTPPSEVPE